MATHSNILAWEVPWIEEPGELKSMGLQKTQTWFSCLTAQQPRIVERLRDLEAILTYVKIPCDLGKLLNLHNFWFSFLFNGLKCLPGMVVVSSRSRSINGVLLYSQAPCRSSVTTIFFAFIQHSVQFSYSVVSNSLQPYGLQHDRPPCPSPTPRVYPNSCPLSRWYHPTISSSVIPFFSSLQSFSALGFFPNESTLQWPKSGGQSIGVSTSVLAVNTQDLPPLGCTGWIPCSPRRLFFGAPKSLQMVTATVKLKDTYSLSAKLWST